MLCRFKQVWCGFAKCCVDVSKCCVDLRMWFVDLYKCIMDMHGARMDLYKCDIEFRKMTWMHARADASPQKERCYEHMLVEAVSNKDRQREIKQMMKMYQNKIHQKEKCSWMFTSNVEHVRCTFLNSIMATNNYCKTTSEYLSWRNQLGKSTASEASASKR